MLSAQNRRQKINGDHTVLPAFTFQTHQHGGNEKCIDPTETHQNDVTVKTYKPRSSGGSFFRQRRDEVLGEFIKATEESYTTLARSITYTGENGRSVQEGVECTNSESTIGSGQESGHFGLLPKKKQATEENNVTTKPVTSPRALPQESLSRESSSEQDHQSRYERLIQHKIKSNPSPQKVTENPDNDINENFKPEEMRSNSQPDKLQRSKGLRNSGDSSRESFLGNRVDHKLRLKLSSYSKRKKQEHISTSKERTISNGTSSNTSSNPVSIIPEANGPTPVYPQPTSLLYNSQKALIEERGVNSTHIITRQNEQDQANNYQLRPQRVHTENKTRDLDTKDGIDTGVLASSRVDIRRLHRQQQAKAIADKTNGAFDKKGKPQSSDTHSNNTYSSNQHDLSSTNGARKNGNDSIELNTPVNANIRQLESINKPVIKTGYKSPNEVRGRPIDCSHNTGGEHFKGRKTQRTGGNNEEIVSHNCIKDSREKNSVATNEIQTLGNAQTGYDTRLDHGILKHNKGQQVLDTINGQTQRDYNDTEKLQKWKSGNQSDQNKDHVSRLTVTRESKGNSVVGYPYSSRASSKASTTSDSEGGTPNSSASKLSDRLRRNIRTPLLPNKGDKLPVKQSFSSKSHEVLSAASSIPNKDTPVSAHSSQTCKKTSQLTQVLPGPSSRNVYLSAQSCENFSHFDKDDFKSALQRLKANQGSGTPSPVGGYRKLTPGNLKQLQQISETEPSDENDDDFSEDSDVEDQNEQLSAIGYRQPRRAYALKHNAADIDQTSSRRGTSTNPKIWDRKLETTRPYLASKSQEKFKSSSLPNMRSDSQKIAMQALPSYASATGKYVQGNQVMKSASFDTFARTKRKQHIDASILTVNHTPSQQRKNSVKNDVQSPRILHATSMSEFQKYRNEQPNGIEPERPKTGYRRHAVPDATEDRSEFIPSETESVSLFSDTCSTASGYSDNAHHPSTGKGYLESLRSGKTVKDSISPRTASNSTFPPNSAKGKVKSVESVLANKQNGTKPGKGDSGNRGSDIGSSRVCNIDGLNINDKRTVMVNGRTQNDGKMGYLQKLQLEKSHEHFGKHQPLGHTRSEGFLPHGQRPKSSKGRQRLSEPELQFKSNSKENFDEYNRRRISSDSRESIHHTSPVDSAGHWSTHHEPVKRGTNIKSYLDSKQTKQHGNNERFRKPEILKLDVNSHEDNAMISVPQKYNKPQVNVDIDSGNDTDVDGEIEILNLDQLDSNSTEESSYYDKHSPHKSTREYQTEESTSRSAGSEASSAWENGTGPLDNHGNTKNTNKHHMFHRQSDNTATNYDRCPVDTPRLTPKQLAMVREQTEREINMSSRALHSSTKRDENDTSNSKRVMHKSNKSSKMYRPNDVIDSNNSSYTNPTETVNMRQYPSQGLNAIYKEDSGSLVPGKQRNKKLPDVRRPDSKNALSTNFDLHSKNSVNGKPSIKPRKLQPIGKMADVDINERYEMRNGIDGVPSPFQRSPQKCVNSNVNNSNSTGNAALIGILTKPKRARSKGRSKSEGFESQINILRLENNSLSNGENDSPFDSCYSESPGELTDNSLNLDGNTKIESWSRRHSEY